MTAIWQVLVLRLEVNALQTIQHPIKHTGGTGAPGVSAVLSIECSGRSYATVGCPGTKHKKQCLLLIPVYILMPGTI